MMASESDIKHLVKCNNRLFNKIYKYNPQHHDKTCEAVFNQCLTQGADINAVDRNNGGNTVLHVAVIEKSKSLVSFLLNNGAKPNIRNEEGLTAFELAKQMKCHDVIGLFETSSQREVFFSHESVKFEPYSDGYLLNILRSKPSQSVISIDISGRDSDILLNEGFYKTIEMFENLIIVDVFVGENTPTDDSVVLHHLNSVRNPVIIQCRSSSGAKVYFKEFQRDADFIDLNSQPMDVDQNLISSLEDVNSFGIQLILEGFIQSVLGKFNDDEHRSLFNSYLIENEIRLLDYAVKHNHLLAVRFLLQYKVQPNLLNYPIQTLSREMLAALLIVEFPIPAGKIQLSTDVVDQFRQCKDELFKDAADNQRQDLIEFLLQCVSDLDCKVLIRSLVERGSYIIALAILKADGLYPDDFDSVNIIVDIPGGQELIDFFSERNQLHDLIINNTLENVKQHFVKLCKSRLYFNTKNESAVATALRNKKFDVYGFLWSRGVCFNDNEEKQLMHQLNDDDKYRLREQMTRFMSQIGESSIDYLLSKTRLPQFQMDAKLKQQIRNYYEQLNKIPEVSIIFAVVQYSNYLDIIFDFDNESTIEVDPMSRNSEGIYYPSLGRIYIGAKLDEKKLLGVVAHELTHLAMQLVYSNQCKPYFRADIVEEWRFNKLVTETSRLPCVDPIISVVFNTNCYHINARPAELIVRINHMLAVHGLENGETMLKNQVPHLQEYYKSKVMSQCKAFVLESHIIMMRNRVKILNDNSGLVKCMNESIIHFKSQIDIEEFLQNDEKRIVLFSTTNSSWITSQIYQHFKDIKLSDVQFTFLNFEELLDFKCWSISASHVFVLTASFNLEVDQMLNLVVDWVKRILNYPLTKLVLVLRDTNVGIIKTRLQCLVPEMRDDKHLELESFLDSDQQLFIYKTKTVRLSTINVYQILKTWFCSCENSIVVLKFQDFLNTYFQYKQVLISDACKIIVLESNSNYDDIPVELLTPFKLAIGESGKKFIVVTPVSVDCLLANRVDKIQQSSIVHNVSLSKLTVDTSELLLSLSVRFQGKWVQMKELIKTSSYDAVDADTIMKLANKEVIDIGPELPSVETFYIPRTLRHGARIESEWVKKHLKKEDMILKEIAVCLDDKGVHIVNLDSSNGKHFQELCEQHPNMVIHWLKRIGDNYIKKKTKYPPYYFNEFQEYINTELTEDLSEDSFIGQLNEHRLVIVSDLAGMGKTTLLTHIAQLLKDKHPCMWIVQVNLNMCTDVFEEEVINASFNGGEMEKAMNFLIEKLLGSTAETDLERILIEECIRSTGDIVILFDAFDELKEEQQKVMIKLINCLQKTKVKQMWLTTRPHVKELLDSELSQFSLTLVTFTENDQLNCITKIWMQKLSVKSRVEKFAKALLKRFNDCISDKEREFTGIPLQSFLLAQAFESECRAFHDSTDEEPHLPTRLNLTDLYKHFVNTKFDICQFLKTGIKPSTPVADSNKKHLYPDYLREHQLLALFTLFDEQQRGIILNNESKIDNVEEISKTLFPYGIINKMVGGQPQFVHRTFAEYFTAEFIVARLQSRENNEVFIGYLVHGQILSLSILKTVRVFIDMLLLDIKPCSLDLGKQSDHRLTSEQLWKSLRIATEEANLNIFKLIFYSVNGLNLNCPEGAAVFFLAIRLHCFEVMELMLCAGYDVNCTYLHRRFNRTPLCEAVLYDNAESCEWLLQNGAKCHIPLDSDSNSISVGLWNKWKGCTALHVAFMLKRFESVSVLLKYEADVNATDAYGLTPLHIAAISGLKDAVDLLVANKADINAVNVFGYTPLDEAIRWLRMEVVDYMVNLEGLDVNATNGSGLTPLHVASVYGIRYIVQTLINHGADIHALVDLDKARSTKDDRWHLTEYLKTTTGHAAVTPLFLAKLCTNEVVVAVFKRLGTPDVNVISPFKQYELIRKLIKAENNLGVGRNFPQALGMFYTENAKYRHII